MYIACAHTAKRLHLVSRMNEIRRVKASVSSGFGGTPETKQNPNSSCGKRSVQGVNSCINISYNFFEPFVNSSVVLHYFFICNHWRGPFYIGAPKNFTKIYEKILLDCLVLPMIKYLLAIGIKTKRVFHRRIIRASRKPFPRIS